MSFFAGFSGRFGEELARSRAEEADRAERQSALESNILQHLSTSPDPEIASHAITGLLDLAGPQKRAGGLAGWLGKVAQHPALPTIRQLVSSGRQVEDQPPQAPRMNVEEGVQELPGSPVEVPGVQSQPAPQRVAATPPPAFAQGYQPATTKTVPRHVLETPDDLAARQVATAEATAQAHEQGTLQGKLNVVRGGPGHPPLTDEEQELLFPGKAMVSAGTVQGKDTPYGSMDNAGRPLSPTGYYTAKADPRDPSKVVYFPSTQPASVSNQAAINARQSFQMYAGPDGKTPGKWRVTRDGSKAPEFLGYIPQRGSYLPFVDPDTGETTYQQAAAPMTPVPQTPGAAGAQPPPSVPRGTPVAGGPPAASVASPAGQVPLGGPPTAATPGGGPKGIPGGRKRNLQQTEGAYIGPNGAPQVGRALFDAATGKYYAAEDAAREAVGFIPGAEGAYATTAYSQANNTLITIAAAKKAIVDAGLVTNNDPAKTAELLQKFYSGVVGDNPIEAAVASLTNLAGIQGATQYVRSNSRSYQMFQAALQHLPNVPSQRVAAMSQIPVVGGLVTPTTSALAGGHGWDSFASMYRKLEQAEKIIGEGKGALAELTGKTAEHAVGAGGRGAAPAPGGRAGGPPAAAQEEFIGPDGKTYIKTGVNPDGSIRGRLKGPG